MTRRILRIAVGLIACLVVAGACSARSLKVSGNKVVLDGKPGQLLYRSSGDLDGDGRKETVFSVLVLEEAYNTYLLVARPGAGGWKVVAENGGPYELRGDVTDINGDGRLEIVERGISGDGHGVCNIYVLRNDHLKEIGRFGQTRFRDLSGDGVPEVLSIEMVSFGYIGDHWLTIYKWDGHGYTDVSRRYPREYDAVILDIKQEIYALRYTTAHGARHDPASDPEAFADLYYHLGLAYDYRGMPEKAKEQYAIAYRLDPDDEGAAKAFRKAWGLGGRRDVSPSP